MGYFNWASEIYISYIISPRASDFPEPAAGAKMAILSQAKDKNAPVSCL